MYEVELLTVLKEIKENLNRIAEALELLRVVIPLASTGKMLEEIKKKEVK